MLPAHRKERAALEAVASTMSPDVARLTGQAAAAAYLAALLGSLQRLMETTKPSAKKDKEDESEVPKKLSRKELKNMRRKSREAEEAVKGMAGPNLHPTTIGKSDDAAMSDGGMDEGNDTTGEEVDLVPCLVYLVGLAVGGCSQAVVNSTYHPTLSLAMDAVDHAAGSSLTSRHASTVFARILSIVNSALWSKPIVQRAYLYLLRQTTDSDPKARRKAREALQALLNCPRGSLICSKTSVAASSHFVAELKSNLTSLEFQGDSKLESSPIPSSFIHLLTSIERFAVYLLPLDAAKVAKELIIVASRSPQEISSFSFLALWALLKHESPGAYGTSGSSGTVKLLPEKDLGKLVLATLKITVLEDSAVEWKLAYASCITDGSIAYINYFDESRPSDEYVLKTLKKLCMIFLSPDASRELIMAVSSCFGKLCMHKWALGRPDVAALLEGLVKKSKPSLLPQSLSALKKYLEQKMSSGMPRMAEAVGKILKGVLSKREQAVKEKDVKAKNSLDSVLAATLRGGGAAILLSLCELKYDAKMHITNSWLMPILSENLRGAPLSLFESLFVPLEAQLKAACDKCTSEKRFVEAKNIGMYRAQVWGLLSGFCHHPPDLGQKGSLTIAFKSIYECLAGTGNAVTTQSCGISALRQLSATVFSFDAEDPTAYAKTTAFASKLKKLFPCIMQVAEKLSDERRGSLMDALRTACQATRNVALVAGLLRKSIKRLLELQLQLKNRSSEDVMDDSDRRNKLHNQHAAADLVVAIAESKMLPTEASEISFIEKAMFPFFSDRKESSLQKKAYRITSLLISERPTQVTGGDFSDFLMRISEAGKTVAPGARAARHGLMTTLLEQHLKLSTKEEKMKLLQSINDAFLPEIILGTRESSEKTRTAAFATLVSAARAWNVADGGADMEGLQAFLMSIAAGLGGRTVAMLSATITSLARLIYDFQGEASMNTSFAELIDSLYAAKSKQIENEMSGDGDGGDSNAKNTVVQPGPIAILLRHDASEVRRAALGAVKVATRALAKPTGRLDQILPGIIPGLVHVAARSKNHDTRLKVRVILERLLRRCGRDVLEANFPAEHIKLLDAVRKKHSRDLVKKHESKDKRRALAAARNGMADNNAGDPNLSDFDIEDSDSDIERELVDGDDLLSGKSGAQKRKASDSGEGVTDLLTSKSNGQSRAVGEAAKEGRKDLSWKPAKQRDDGIKYAEDGKPIFVESDDDSGAAEVGSDKDEQSDDEVDEGRNSSSVTGKRDRSGRHGNESKRKKVRGSFGEEYRGKRGAGDIKRPGRPDPYAYVPLGIDLLGSTRGRNRERDDMALSRLVRRNGGARKGKRTKASGKQ